MSQFHGPQEKGAMRARRKQKRKDAEKRNAAYRRWVACGRQVDRNGKRIIP